MSRGEAGKGNGPLARCLALGPLGSALSPPGLHQGLPQSVRGRLSSSRSPRPWLAGTAPTRTPGRQAILHAGALRARVCEGLPTRPAVWRSLSLSRRKAKGRDARDTLRHAAATNAVELHVERVEDRTGTGPPFMRRLLGELGAMDVSLVSLSGCVSCGTMPEIQTISRLKSSVLCRPTRLLSSICTSPNKSAPKWRLGFGDRKIAVSCYDVIC